MTRLFRTGDIVLVHGRVWIDQSDDDREVRVDVGDGDIVYVPADKLELKAPRIFAGTNVEWAHDGQKLAGIVRAQHGERIWVERPDGYLVTLHANNVNVIE